MYEHNENQLIMPDKFSFPFGGRLNLGNRCIVMSSIILWVEIETEYTKRMGDTEQVTKAYLFRLIPFPFPINVSQVSKRFVRRLNSG